MLAIEHLLWPQFIIFIVSVYLMIELNNRNTLMRQYSRMVSCSYIAMMLMTPWLFHSLETMIFQVCMIACFSQLFQTYQKRQAMGHKYWGYLFYGIAAVVWPPVLYALPFFWVAEAVFLMSFSWKSLWASIFGILTPLWVMLPYIVYENKLENLATHYQQMMPGEQIIAAFSDPMLLIPHTLPCPLMQLVVLGTLLLFFILGGVHYLRNSYTDKIHVRMLYQFIMLIGTVVIVSLLLTMALPFEHEHTAGMLVSLAIVCISPPLAHYIAFTYTRLTNISVIVIMLGIFCITIYENIEVLLHVTNLSLPNIIP